MALDSGHGTQTWTNGVTAAATACPLYLRTRPDERYIRQTNGSSSDMPDVDDSTKYSQTPFHVGDLLPRLVATAPLYSVARDKPQLIKNVHTNGQEQPLPKAAEWWRSDAGHQGVMPWAILPCHLRKSASFSRRWNPGSLAASTQWHAGRLTCSPIRTFDRWSRATGVVKLRLPAPS